VWNLSVNATILVVEYDTCLALLTYIGLA